MREMDQHPLILFSLYLELDHNYCCSSAVCQHRDNFSIYQSKIMTICLALLIIVTHQAHSQYPGPFIQVKSLFVSHIVHNNKYGCILYSWFIRIIHCYRRLSSWVALLFLYFMFNKLLFWYRTRVLHKLFTSFACPTHISSFTTINYSFTDIQESYQEQIVGETE